MSDAAIPFPDLVFGLTERPRHARPRLQRNDAAGTDPLEPVLPVTPGHLGISVDEWGSFPNATPLPSAFPVDCRMVTFLPGT